MDINEFKQTLKDGPRPGTYLFSGREDYLKSYYVNELISTVLGAEDDPLNLMRCEYSAISSLEFSDYAQALPVFSEKKVLYVSALDTDSPRKELAEAVSVLCRDFPDYLYIVFDRRTTDPQSRAAAFADIKKAAGEHAFELCVNEQDSQMLRRWLVRHAKASGKELAPQAADRLLAIADNNMLNLENELAKACAHAVGSEVTATDVDAVTVPTIDAQIYELADAIIAADAAACMRVTDDLLEKFPDTMVLASVYNCFVRLYKVALLREKGLDASNTSKHLDMKSGTVNKNLRILRRMSLTQVRRMVLICCDADRELKRVSRDKRRSMDVFFLRLMDAAKN